MIAKSGNAGAADGTKVTFFKDKYLLYYSYLR
jgi:hypothetical protein